MIIPSGAMSTEHEVGLAILTYLPTRPYGEASLAQIFFDLPKYIALTPADLEVSRSRSTGTGSYDKKWHARVRNIDAHKTTPGNLIHDGLLVKRRGGGYQLAERAKAIAEKRAKELPIQE